MQRKPIVSSIERRKTKASIEKEELVRNERRNTQDGGLTAGGVKGAEELLRCLDGREQNEEAAAQIDVLRQTFNLFDADQDGFLCAEEFRRILSVMGLDVTVDEAEDLMSDVDSDGTGKMEFDEFIVLLSKRQDKTSSDLEVCVSCVSRRIMHILHSCVPYSPWHCSVRVNCVTSLCALFSWHCSVRVNCVTSLCALFSMALLSACQLRG